MLVSATPLASSISRNIRNQPVVDPPDPITAPSGEIGTTPVAGPPETVEAGPVAAHQNDEGKSRGGPRGKKSDSDSAEFSETARSKHASEAKKAAKERSEAESPEELSPEEKDLIDRLKMRDREVRTHEQAHLRAAGDLANGPPKYDFQTGPDGRRYAIGGSVSIDVSPGRDHEETIQRAERIKRSALAPAEPSSKDRQVAAKADAMKSDAQRELAREELEEGRDSGNEVSVSQRNDEPPGINNNESDNKNNRFGISGMNQGDDNSPNFGVSTQGQNKKSSISSSVYGAYGLGNDNGEKGSIFSLTA